MSFTIHTKLSGRKNCPLGLGFAFLVGESLLHYEKIQGVFKSIAAAVMSASIFSATVYASKKCTM